MPFPLRLGKKSGHYELSKELFVLTVTLPDKPLQCTLSDSSTGKDCVDYLCHRLDLKQSEFFGLRFKAKRTGLRWVELEKPLKKQLEKFGETTQLYFAVMFFIPHPHLNILTDDMARYFYFLQMKSYVIEGRLRVSPAKAILLAAYALQVLLGDHDADSQPIVLLKNYQILPKFMTHSQQIFEDLFQQVIQTHRTMIGLPTAQAALSFINVCQLVEGYGDGEENFSARQKDYNDPNNRLQISYGTEGLIVRTADPEGQNPPVKFRWVDVLSISGNKRNFCITCSGMENVQYQMEDVETTRYAVNICTQQLQFWRNLARISSSTRKPNLITNVSTVRPEKEASMPLDIVGFQQKLVGDSPVDLRSSYDQLSSPLAYNHAVTVPIVSHSNGLYLPSGAPMVPSQNGADFVQLRHNNVPNQNLTNSDAVLSASHQSVHSLPYNQSLNSSLASGVNHPHQQHQFHQQGVKYFTGSNGQDVSRSLESQRIELNRSLSSSINGGADVTVRNFSSPPPNGVGSHRTSPLVPAYQPTPDYESALRAPSLQEYRNSLINYHQMAPHLQQSGQMAIVRSTGGNQVAIANSYDQLTPSEAATAYGQAVLHTYSNPEISNALVDQQHQQENRQMIESILRNYRPPPAYRVVSASTPDLSAGFVGSQLPFNTRMRYGANGPMAQPQMVGTQLDVTLENLSMDNLDVIDVVQHQMAKQRLMETLMGEARMQQSAMGTSGEIFHRFYPGPNQEPIESTWNQSVVEMTQQLQPSRVETESDSRPISGQLSFSRPDLLQDSGICDSNDDRLAAMETKFQQGLLGSEFDQLPMTRASAGFSTATRPENLSKNRYSRILPYEDTRVTLRPTSVNPTGYINASNVRISFPEATLRFVATQAPLQETAADFWQMVWETGANIIVMFSSVSPSVTSENERPFYQYWFNNIRGTTSKLRCGDYRVTLQFSSDVKGDSVGHVTSSLVLKHIPSEAKRHVYHIQYLDWTDESALPTEDSFLDLLDEIKSVRRHVLNDSESLVTPNKLSPTDVSHGVTNGLMKDRRKSSLISFNSNGTAPNNGHNGVMTKDADVMDLSNVSSTSSGSWKRGGWKLKISSPSDHINVESESKPPSGQPSGPLIVHCNSGAGRTGVLLLTEIMIYCLEHNHKIDVSRALVILRQQRMQSVQTLTQYKFVYSCLIRYLKRSRLI